MAGGDQTGKVGATLPDSLVVAVTDADGIGIGGIRVTWSIDTGAGAVEPVNSETDDDGKAAARWTLGPTAGEQRVVAEYAGFEPAAFIATAQPGPGSLIAVAPDSIRLFEAGDTARLTAAVTDLFGNPMENASVEWRSSDTTVARVDTLGLVTAVAAGLGAVVATLPGNLAPSDSAAVVVRPATPAIAIVPGSVVALTGDTVPLAAVDEIGLPVEPGALNWGTSDPAVADVDPGGVLRVRAAGSATVTAATDQAADSIAVTVTVGSGIRVPELAHYDSIVPAFMEEAGLAGGAVAVAWQGRLLLARGYGLADTVTLERVRPESLFRIASVSKTVAAVTALRLIEEGRLDMDAPVFERVQDLAPDPLPDADPRLDSITVRHLLEHAGGWDMASTFDPAFGTRRIAERMGVPPPATSDQLVEFMLGQPLQFDPGTDFAYSNFGYILLARVIERATGLPFEAAARDVLLDPAGLGMKLGHTLPEDRHPDEVSYYADGLSISVFPPHDPVPRPYGAFYLEAMDGSSGWVSSAVDLARFLSVVDGDGGIPDLLSPATLDAMTARQPIPVWASASTYYGLGWWVQPFGGGLTWWAEGSFGGTTAVIVRSYAGVVWAAVFNGSVPPGQVNAMMWDAFGRTETWPANDLFDLYR